MAIDDGVRFDGPHDGRSNGISHRYNPTIDQRNPPITRNKNTAAPPDPGSVTSTGSGDRVSGPVAPIGGGWWLEAEDAGAPRCVGRFDSVGG